MPIDPQAWLQALGRVAASVQHAPEGVPGRIWDELRPWLQELAFNAAPKWLPRMVFEFPCGVPSYVAGRPVAACPRLAVANCDCCGQPVCLDHARFDKHGDAICFVCVAGAIQAKRVGQPPPGPAPIDDAALKRARRVLGVRAADPWSEVTAAYKRLLAQWHPDRFKTEKERAKAETRFKDIRAAYDLLQKHREQTEERAA